MKLKTKFQDEDFDLGEVINANIHYGGYDRIKLIATAARGGEHTFYFESLKELNGMFEDYDEPKVIWWLNDEGCVNHTAGEVDEYFEKNREIGNYFETKEEAEKAVEKLKAWKRVKDAGFKFVGNGAGLHTLRYSYEGEWCLIAEDFNLLFGGEEQSKLQEHDEDERVNYQSY